MEPDRRNACSPRLPIVVGYAATIGGMLTPVCAALNLITIDLLNTRKRNDTV